MISKTKYVTRIASIMQPHLTNEEINECLDGKLQIEWVIGGVSDKKELWTCDKNRISVLAGPLSKKEMSKYLHIRNCHYVIYDESKVDCNRYASAVGIYFFWCCANSEPYITVTPAKKYCSVGIDLITLRDSNKMTLNDEGRKKVYELFDKTTTRRDGAFWSGGPIGTYAFSNSIPKNKAHDVATELYQIWQQYKEQRSDSTDLTQGVIKVE